MPFKSKAQQRYLFSRKPEVAEKFADKTSKKSYKKLPEHVDGPKSINEHMKNVSHQYMRSKSVK